MKAFACATLALAMTGPVLADPPDDFRADIQVSADNDSSSSEYLPGAKAGSIATQSDACVRVMERVFYMADPADLDRALNARHEMELARNAFQSGNESACKRHALLALEDRN